MSRGLEGQAGESAYAELGQAHGDDRESGGELDHRPQVHGELDGGAGQAEQRPQRGVGGEFAGEETADRGQVVTQPGG
jgi:hypothetical protein